MRVLIINIGPYGDVLRTTVLLNEFKNDSVYWLTSNKNIDILNSKFIKKLFFIEDLSDEYYSIKYDLVISLNEEYPFKEDVKYDKLIGIKNDGTYTDDSAYWFNMSLASKYDKCVANKLKKQNKKSYNQILIEMIGGKWEDQEYIFEYENIESNKIGLISTIDGVFKSKRWNGFNELYEILKNKYDIEFLEWKSSIKEHINDINKCGLIICPDTFGMHAAIAMKKKIITIFNCTSPYEIYGYGRMKKIVSPLYSKYFYTKEYNEELSNSINVNKIIKQISI
jgi:heptosyltransferase-2